MQTQYDANLQQLNVLNNTNVSNPIFIDKFY